MEVTRLRVLYGVLGEGAESVARDPTGYLAIEQGIYRQHGLELSWDHIQGTDERNQALAGGEADLSLVIGRASLQHFLRSGATRVIGSCMNSSPYLLMAPPEGRRALGPPGQGSGMPPGHRRDGAAGRDVAGPRASGVGHGSAARSGGYRSARVGPPDGRSGRRGPVAATLRLRRQGTGLPAGFRLAGGGGGPAAHHHRNDGVGAARKGGRHGGVPDSPPGGDSLPQGASKRDPDHARAGVRVCRRSGGRALRRLPDVAGRASDRRPPTSGKPVADDRAGRRCQRVGVGVALACAGGRDPSGPGPAPSERYRGAPRQCRRKP